MFAINSIRTACFARCQTACIVLALVGSIMFFAACNRPSIRPGRAAVSGSTNYKGQPLPAGIVMFLSENDPTLYGSTIIRPDGTYSMNDVPIGDVWVSIDTRPALEGGPESFIRIPLKYSKGQTSGLRYTIEKNGNRGVNFDLK